MIVRNIVSKTVARVTTIVLIKYRIIGTPVVDDKNHMTLKFLSVGLSTMNVGGKRKSSSMGLNAWLKMNTTGSSMKMLTGTSIR